LAKVYSKRLLAADNLTGTVTATVPVGTLWVVRDLDTFLEALPGTTIAINCATYDGTFTPTFFYASVGNVPTTLHWTGRIVIPAGGHLQASAGGSGIAQVTISGYELSLP
jgi:hypothetical protein